MSELQKYRSWDLVENEEGIYSRGTVVYDAYEADKLIAARDARLDIMQRAIDWILYNGAVLCLDGLMRDGNDEVLEIPADVAPIICPGSGKGDAG